MQEKLCAVTNKTVDCLHFVSMASKSAADGNHFNSVVVNICVIIIATIIGMLYVVEFGVNISLSNWIQHPLRSAWINFSIGAILLLPPFLCCNHAQDTPRTTLNNLISAFKEDKKNILVLLNGSFGVIAVISPIYIAPKIGFPLYTISVIFGQIIASMLMDNFGFCWTQIKHLSLVNLFGALAAIFGIIFYQIPSFQTYQAQNIMLIILYTIIAVFAGIFVTVQAALNRRLKELIDATPYHSAFLSFLNAVIILTAINLVLYIVNNDWFETNGDYLQWHMFFGGLIGAISVSMMIICPSYIGFVATYICVIFGSLIMSVTFDYLNAFGVETNDNVHKSVFRIFGVILVFIGAVLVNVPPSASQVKGYKVTKRDDEDVNSYKMQRVTTKSIDKLDVNL